MHIMLIQAELHLPMSHSLKEKRGVLKPLLHELRRDFNLSVSEVEASNHWQSAVVAAVGVSGLRRSLERLERDFLHRLETNGSLQVVHYAAQWL